MIYNFLAKTIPTLTGEVSVRNIVQLLEFSIYGLISVALGGDVTKLPSKDGKVNLPLDAQERRNRRNASRRNKQSGA